ncbi:hypothetical protein FRC20_001675 [Serendipita sp. 405]|nr:hypothetical protein FRC20_001675 [Serendipita sp. 405]
MDTANKEEALKALSIAKRYLNADPPNIATAKKLALKSVSLCETSEAMNLLERIRVLEEDSKYSRTTTPNGSAKPDSTQPNGSAGHSTSSEPFAGREGMKHRTTHTQDAPSVGGSSAASKGKSRDDEKREYTPEQLAVVKRIRKCKATEYYEILSLQKDCEEAEVKKAYRKLALQLHPDKNGAPGADEAFKMVSKAFQVLSDTSLRAAFDRDGGDPESRFGSGMRPTSGQAGGTQQAEGPRGFKGVFLQLLPIIMFLLLAFSNTIFDLLSSAVSTPDPSYQFAESSHHSLARTTGGRFKVQYFVNPQQFTTHPMSTSDSGNARSPQLQRFEKGVEERWVNWKYSECVRSKEIVERQVENLRGIFGIGADWEKIDKLRKETIPSCEELRKKDIRI